MDHFITTGPFEGGREQTDTAGYATAQEWEQGHAAAIAGRKPSGDYLGSVYIDKDGFLRLVETVRGDPPMDDAAFLAAHTSAISAKMQAHPPAFP